MMKNANVWVGWVLLSCQICTNTNNGKKFIGAGATPVAVKSDLSTI
jgi:hypothetical protein